jgi:hypothetical protein
MLAARSLLDAALRINPAYDVTWLKYGLLPSSITCILVSSARLTTDRLP